MEIQQAQIEELKKKHGAVFEGEISFTDAYDAAHEVTFVFREPKTSDVEFFAKDAQSAGSVEANLNLISRLVVFPEAAEVVKEIRNYPGAYGKFIEQVVQPFFGANAVARKRAL